MIKKIIGALCLSLCMGNIFSCPQIKPVAVTKTLIQKLSKMKPDTSNAHQIEQIIGPACACLPNNDMPSETWNCQWQGNLKSNRLENTINITFESGMIAKIIAIDEKGNFIH